VLRGCFTLNGKQGLVRVAKSCANTSVYYTADLTDDTTSGRDRLRFKQPRGLSWLEPHDVGLYKACHRSPPEEKMRHAQGG
jgi:hypothetical protein